MSSNSLGEFSNNNGILFSKQNALMEPIDDLNSTWSDEISYLTIHSAYHIGQIVTARKRQNSWKDEYGV